MDSDVTNGPNHSGALLLAAALSFAAGIIHFTVAPEYLGEWWGYGFFFVMVAIAQITYGLLLFMWPLARQAGGHSSDEPDPTGRMIYLSAAIGNLAVVALYVTTRTMGIPFFGPQAGRVEPVDALSIAATLMEIALAAILWVLARRASPVGEPASLTIRS